MRQAALKHALIGVARKSDFRYRPRNSDFLFSPQLTLELFRKPEKRL